MDIYNTRELFNYLNGSEFSGIITGFLKARHYHTGTRVYQSKKSYTGKTFQDRTYNLEIELSNKDMMKKSYQKKYISKLRDIETTNDDMYLDDAVQSARIYIYKNLYDYDWEHLIRASCWHALSYITKLRKPLNLENEIDVYGYELEMLGYDSETETQTVFVNKLLNSLSKEQQQIINLISQGLSQREIAGKLHISRRKLNYKLSELRQFAKKLAYDF